MTTRKDLMWGAECSFDYDYTNADDAQCFPEEGEVQTYSEELPPKVFDILRKRRKDVLQLGFLDSEFTKKPCTISRCKCDHSGSSKECTTFFLTKDDIEACLDASPNLGTPKSEFEFWAMPDVISQADLERITLTDFGFDDASGNAGAVTAVREKLNAESCVYLKSYLLCYPGGEVLIKSALSAIHETTFKDCVHLNASKKNIHTGDESKMIAYFQDEGHPVAKLLAAVTDKLLPGYNVATSKDTCGKSKREVAVLNQTETKIGPVLKAESIMQSVHQILHGDTVPLNSEEGEKNALGLHRPSFKHYVDGEGPISVWIPLPEAGKTISMVIYLGSSKAAVKLLANCAKHFRMMQQAYMRVQPGASDDEFLRVWIGANVLLMRNELQSSPAEAVSIPCSRGDVLLMHGLAVHGGTDELGYRAFTSMSKKVMQNECLSTSFAKLIGPDCQQGFSHNFNAFHSIPDSPVFAALLHTTMKPLKVLPVPSTENIDKE